MPEKTMTDAINLIDQIIKNHELRSRYAVHVMHLDGKYLVTISAGANVVEHASNKNLWTAVAQAYSQVSIRREYVLEETESLINVGRDTTWDDITWNIIPREE